MAVCARCGDKYHCLQAGLQGVCYGRYRRLSGDKRQYCGAGGFLGSAGYPLRRSGEKAGLPVNDADYEALLKIVEAEAGGEDENGKLLVANVVLNRVNSNIFPDTVTGVVYQKEFGVCQFSPVSDGRINRVRVSEETRRAVERAVYGEDISQGALYFVARRAVAPDRMQWFDNHLTWLFAYGGHEFFGS